MQAPQLRPRLDPGLLHERPVRRAVGRKRVGLAPAAVAGEHQLPVQPLARGMLGDEHLELRRQLGVPAEAELGLDAVLDRAHPQRGQVLRLGHEVDVGQRRAAPHPLRPAQRLCGALRLTRRLGARLGERVEIQLARLHAQAVADLGGEQPVLGERLAQARDPIG